MTILKYQCQSYLEAPYPKIQQKFNSGGEIIKYAFVHKLKQDFLHISIVPLYCYMMLMTDSRVEMYRSYVSNVDDCLGHLGPSPMMERLRVVKWISKIAIIAKLRIVIAKKSQFHK